MKAIAVIDIPDVSNIEDMFLTGNVHISYKTNDISGGLIQGLDKVPLKPMPTELEWFSANGDFDEQKYVEGWNACLEEITGDAE